MAKTRYDFDDPEKAVQEETKHARRGACLALIILPLLVAGCCTLVFRYNPRAQMAYAYATAWVTYNGLGLPQSVGAPYLNGFPGLARWACQLESQSPPPSDQTLTQIEEAYERLVPVYKSAVRDFYRNGGSRSNFPDFDQVPNDFAGGKIFYCYR